MADDTVDPVRRAYEAWNRDDVEAALDLMHPDIEIHRRGSRELFFPGMEQVYRGREGFREFWRAAKEPFEYFRSEPQRFIHEGDKVIVPSSVEAKGKGSGAEVETSLTEVWTLRDELIVKLENHNSLEEALEATGVRA